MQSFAILNSSGLGGKQLVIVRGPLVVVLPVSDHRGETFADKGLGNVDSSNGDGGTGTL